MDTRVTRTWCLSGTCGSGRPQRRRPFDPKAVSNATVGYASVIVLLILLISEVHVTQHREG